MLLSSLQNNILAAAELRHPEAYLPVVITGSGTAANETVLSSILGRESESTHRLLVLTNGEFGERLAKTANIYHKGRVDTLTQDWGTVLDLEALEARLSRGDIAWVALVHHETSTGMLNPVEVVGQLCHRHGVRVFVDAVSSFTSDRFDLEAGHVTFMSSSSGKAIGCYPGLSIVIGQRQVFESLKHNTPLTQYLDLYRYYEFARTRLQTPNTPAVPLFLALNKAFELAVEEGMDQRYERLAKLAAYVRSSGQRIGLLPLITDPVLRSTAVTSFNLPSNIDFEEMRLALRAHGFVVYGGKGPLQSRIFQVSTIGHISYSLLDTFFIALDEVITVLKGRMPEAA